MIRVGRSALLLPRYTVRRCLKDGSFAHFFQVPSWARMKGCAIANEALGTDYDKAVLRAEKILLPTFDSWRTGGEDATPIGIGVVVGTLDWMFHEYRRTWSRKTAKRLQPLSPGQCRVHETGIKMICGYVLQDGRRLGSRRVSSIDTAFKSGFVSAAQSLRKGGSAIDLARDTACQLCRACGFPLQSHEDGITVARHRGVDRLGVTAARGAHLRPLHGGPLPTS